MEMWLSGFTVLNSDRMSEDEAMRIHFRFYSFHPFALVVYYTAILFGSMFIVNPVVRLEALLGGVIFLSLIRKKRMVSDIWFYLILFILIWITNPLFSHNGETPLFFMNGNPVTLEAFKCGASIAAAILASIIWFASAAEIIDDEKIVYLAGRFFPRLGLTISMALRFVPRLKKDFSDCENAQKTAGLLISDSFFDRLKFKLGILMSVSAKSVESSVIISRSMRARGYGMKGSTAYSRFFLRVSDVVLAVVSLITFVAEIIAVISGKVGIEFYPSVTELPVNFMAVSTYILYGITAFLPTIIEATEYLKWKYYISKI